MAKVVIEMLGRMPSGSNFIYCGYYNVRGIFNMRCASFVPSFSVVGHFHITLHFTLHLIIVQLFIVVELNAMLLSCCNSHYCSCLIGT